MSSSNPPASDNHQNENESSISSSSNSPRDSSNNSSSNNSSSNNSSSNNSSSNNSSSNNSSSNNSSSNNSSSNNSSSNNSSSNNSSSNNNNIIDNSFNFTTDLSFSLTTTSITQNYVNYDPSLNIVIPPIVDFSLNTHIDGTGFEIDYQQGFSADGSNVTIGIFTTTDASLDTQITQNLNQVVTTYDDAIVDSSINSVFLQIKEYAAEIKCEDFHGKGSIDDYQNLFLAASKIATDSKQMQLDIDVEGFTEFGKAADDLSNLFNGFIMKLQNVNIINDYNFLVTISTALGKIVNLSNIFGRFKETILATTSIQVPKSAHDTSVIITGVMEEINCAMQYIGHFVDSTSSDPSGCELSAVEQNVIAQAVNTIDTWNVLCEQGISVSLQHNPDIQNITHASTELKQTTNTLKNATSTLRTKLAQFNFQ